MMTINYLSGKNWFYICLILLLSWPCYTLFKNPGYQSPIFSSRYFSGAKNLFSEKGKWLYSDAESRWLSDQSQEFVNNYHFRKFPVNSLVENKYNNKGYLYITWVATNLFWWLPDFEAARLFNYLWHLLVSILVLTLFKTKLEKIIFLLLYVLNPLIIYVATYPYYYFWQVIPSLMIILILKGNSKFWTPVTIFIISIICSGIYLTRPTVVFSVLAIFILFANKLNWKKAMLGFTIFVVSSLAFKAESTSSPYGHFYIGIGAYPNPLGIILSDTEPMKLFKKKTGENLGPFNQQSPERMKEYYSYCRDAYLNFLKSHPILIIRNGVMNFFQSYSIGYFTNGKWLPNLISAGSRFYLFCSFSLLQKVFLPDHYCLVFNRVYALLPSQFLYICLELTF